MYISVNGELILKEEARISPFDHGYLYGLGLFETMRTYNHHPFLFDDHIERLKNGLQVVGIEMGRSREELLEDIQTLLRANQYEDAYIRLNVSAGVEDVGLQTGLYSEPTTIIFLKPLLSSHVFPAKDAFLLNTKRNTPETPTRLKSHHFLNNVLAKREIGDKQNAEGIFLNRNGDLAEGIVSNIFWVKEGTVYTPAIETGILNGITRQFVFALLKRRGIPIKEGFYKAEHLLQADEAFMTNSVQEVVPFRTVEKKHFPGNNGELTKVMLKDYETFRDRLWSVREIEVRGC